MNAPFDPYYKWLGIPPAEQPANHYRLLGLALFEADPEVISQGADRQMAFVQTYKTGPHAELSQKLLNELATARLTLLNPNKRAAYDAQLRARLAGNAGSASSIASASSIGVPSASSIARAAPPPISGVAPAAAPNAPPPAEAAPMFVSAPAPSRPAAASPARPTTSSPVALWAGIAVAAVIGLGGIVYVATSGPSKPPKKDRVVADNSNKPPRSRDGVPESTAAFPSSGAATPDVVAPVPTSAVHPADDPASAPRFQPSRPAENPSERPATNETPVEKNRDDVKPAKLAEIVGGYDAPDEIDATRGSKKIEVSGVDFSQPWSLRLEAKTNAFKTKQTLVGWGDDALHAVWLNLDDKVASAGVRQQGSEAFQVAEGLVPADLIGRWASFQVDHDPGAKMLRLFIDDRLVDQKATRYVPQLGGKPTWVLGDASRGGTPFDGLIRNVRIGNRGGSRTDLTDLAGDAGRAPAAATTDESVAARSREGIGRVGRAALAYPDEIDCAKGPLSLEVAEFDPSRKWAVRFDAQIATLANDKQMLVCWADERPDRETIWFRLERSTLFARVRDGSVGRFTWWDTGVPDSAIGKWTKIEFVFDPAEDLVQFTLDGRPIYRTKVGTRPVPQGSNVWLVGDARAGGQRFSGKIRDLWIGNTAPPVSSSDEPGGRSLADLADRSVAELMKTDDKPRLPAPAEDELKAARRELQQEYSARVADARTPAAKITLARALQSRGLTVESPAASYVSFERAAEAAADAKDWRVAWEMLNDLGRKFAVDVGPKKAEALTACQALAKTADGAAEIAGAWETLVDDAIARDEYEQAAKFTTSWDGIARKADDDALKAQIAKRRAALKEATAAYAIAKPAKEVLLEKPEDRAAATIWGRFVVLYKRDADAGLSILAHGDGPLADVAKRELAASRTALDRVKLGDDWWEAAEKETAAGAKKAMKRRAVEHYRFARVGVPSDKRLHLDARVKSFETEYPTFPVGEWVKLLPLLDPNSPQAQYGRWTRDASGLANQPGTSIYGIPVQPDGSYDVAIRFTRVAGENPIYFFFPVGASRVRVGFFTGGVGYHDLVGNNAFLRGDRTRVRDYPIANGVEQAMGVKVTIVNDQASIDVAMNGAPFLHWDGPLNTLIPLAPDAATDRGIKLEPFSNVMLYRSVDFRLQAGGVKHDLTKLPE